MTKSYPDRCSVPLYMHKIKVVLTVCVFGDLFSGLFGSSFTSVVVLLLLPSHLPAWCLHVAISQGSACGHRPALVSLGRVPGQGGGIKSGIQESHLSFVGRSEKSE